jgi:hypothetical protein
MIKHVRFASISKKNIIIKAFPSLRFDSFAITDPHYSISRGAFAVSEHVYHRGLCCSWRCLHHRGLSCIWTCLQYRGLCCSWMCLELHHRGWRCTWTCLHPELELHLDLVEQREPVMLLDVSTCTLQGRELHLDVFRVLVACVCCCLTCLYCRGLCCIQTCLVPWAELHLDVSYPQGPVPTYCRTCSLYLKNNFLTVRHGCFALKITFLCRTCSLCFENNFLSI